MIRHFFMCTIKGGVSDEVVEKKMAEMRRMKDSVPEIEAITVARNLGWAGLDNVITMVVDFWTAFDRIIMTCLGLATNWQRIIMPTLRKSGGLYRLRAL